MQNRANCMGKAANCTGKGPKVNPKQASLIKRAKREISLYLHNFIEFYKI